MKRIPLFSLAIVITVAFTNPPGSIVGRWQKRLPDGSMGGAIFRSDSSYDLSVNGKIFISGKYHVRQDTFAVSDGACGLTYYGTYKLHFFAEDSVRFTVIQDPCRGRREGYNGGTLGRVAPGQAK